MLYREPKLLKACSIGGERPRRIPVSVLYREPKLLKELGEHPKCDRVQVSVLYREPKLLKVAGLTSSKTRCICFSALP